MDALPFACDTSKQKFGSTAWSEGPPLQSNRFIVGRKGKIPSSSTVRLSGDTRSDAFFGRGHTDHDIFMDRQENCPESWAVGARKQLPKHLEGLESHQQFFCCTEGIQEQISVKT